MSSLVTVLDKNTRMSFIALSGFLNLSDDLITTFNLYLYSLQPHTVVYLSK